MKRAIRNNNFQDIFSGRESRLTESKHGYTSTRMDTNIISELGFNQLANQIQIQSCFDLLRTTRRNNIRKFNQCNRYISN